MIMKWSMCYNAVGTEFDVAFISLRWFVRRQVMKRAELIINLSFVRKIYWSHLWDFSLYINLGWMQWIAVMPSKGNMYMFAIKRQNQNKLCNVTLENFQTSFSISQVCSQLRRNKDERMKQQLRELCLSIEWTTLLAVACDKMYRKAEWGERLIDMH